MRDQPINLLPTDIDLYFPNLEGIWSHPGPIQSFTAEDLKPFPKLRVLGILAGQLTTINGDVLKYSPELEHLNLQNNQITNIGPGIFQPSPILNNVKFRGNLCIDNIGRAIAGVAALGITCVPLTIGCHLSKNIVLKSTDLIFLRI